MLSAEAKSIIARAKAIYADRLQLVLERDHLHRFVSIEPESGDYFLGDTFDEAVKFAVARHPSRRTYTIRVGHGAVFHMGGLTK